MEKKEFTIEVVENVTRSGHVTVTARSAEEAEDKVREEWRDGNLNIKMSDGDEPELTQVFAVM